MKVTFLTPPVLIGKRATERVAGCTYTLYPVPNIYELGVAAVLERAGFEVGYLECVIKGWGKKEFLEFLKKDKSDIFVIWTVNLGIENDLEALSLIRSIKPEVLLVFLGPAPTYFSEKFLKDERIFVVRGEPDITTLKLAEAFFQNRDVSTIKGVSCLRRGNFKESPTRELIEDLDSLPFPARHLLERDKYHNPKLKVSPYTAVLTSRNCPYRCIFCVPCSLSFARELEYKKHLQKEKPPVRMRSPENVAKELYLLKEQGYRSISFQDDLFVFDEQRLLKICQSLKETGFLWGCQSRVDKLTEKGVRAMAESGCQYVDMGVESFSQEILDFVKKDLKSEDSIKGIKLLKKYGISAKINILFGACPLETKETIKNTYKMIQELDVDQVMFSIASPFPGTEFYELAKKNGWLLEGEYRPFDVQKKAIVNYPHLKAKDLERAVFWGNIKFFLNPRFFFKQIIKLRSPKEFKAGLLALWRKLFS